MVDISRSQLNCDWPLNEIFGSLSAVLFAVIILLLVYFKFREELKILLYMMLGWRPFAKRNDNVDGKVSICSYATQVCIHHSWSLSKHPKRRFINCVNYFENAWSIFPDLERLLKLFFKGEHSWWRHQMETFSVLLALCAGNSPVSGEFAAQRPVTRIFDVFFDLRLIKRLNKHSRGWWFETLLRPLWRQCNIPYLSCVVSTVTDDARCNDWIYIAQSLTDTQCIYFFWWK